MKVIFHLKDGTTTSTTELDQEYDHRIKELKDWLARHSPPVLHLTNVDGLTTRSSLRRTVLLPREEVHYIRIERDISA